MRRVLLGFVLVAFGALAAWASPTAPRRLATVSDAARDPGSDAIADIVAGKASYSPGSGLTVVIRLASPFRRGHVHKPTGVTLGVELLSSRRDTQYTAAWMQVLPGGATTFWYGSYTYRNALVPVAGSIRGRVITIHVPRPAVSKLRYAMFFGEGNNHHFDYAPDLNIDSSENSVPFRP